MLISWVLSRNPRFTDKDSVQSRTQCTMEEKVRLLAFHNIDLQDEDLTLAVEHYNINLPRGQPSIQVQFQIHQRGFNWNIYSAFEFRKFNKSTKSKFEDILKIQVIIFIKYQILKKHLSRDPVNVTSVVVLGGDSSTESWTTRLETKFKFKSSSSLYIPVS